MQLLDWFFASIPFLSLALSAAVLLAAVLFVLTRLLRHSDGPRGPLPGGPLKTGELIDPLPTDWRTVGEATFAEIESVATGRSRMTGLTQNNGTLYLPCDLGFIWQRVSPPAKWLMALVWLLKQWHHDVVRDDRVVIRVRGKRYSLRAVRVEEGAEFEILKSKVDEAAQKLLGTRLAPREENGGQDGEIWFFRLEP